jgi:anaerobic selenocysteine-containing dehydrogenase
VRKGLAREDLFTVVHDPFMTDTAKYADIVLPAALYLETDDLYRAYGAYWMQWGRAAAKPAGEARSNFDVAQALAQRMGLNEKIFTLRPQEAALELFKGATGPAAQADKAKLFAGESIHIKHDWTASRSRRPRASSSSFPSSAPASASRRCRTGARTRSTRRKRRNGRSGS